MKNYQQGDKVRCNRWDYTNEEYPGSRKYEWGDEDRVAYVVSPVKYDHLRRTFSKLNVIGTKYTSNGQHNDGTKYICVEWYGKCDQNTTKTWWTKWIEEPSGSKIYEDRDQNARERDIAVYTQSYLCVLESNKRILEMINLVIKFGGLELRHNTSTSTLWLYEHPFHY